jgi:plasmid replication initiation protein
VEVLNPNKKECAMNQNTSIESILKTQISDQFLKGMVARMEMSFFKYGDVRDAYPGKMDAIASMQQRLKKYEETGNTEFLMDVANFAMIEFMFPRKEGAFFAATDSDQSPGRTTVLGIETDRPNIAKHQYNREGD